MGQTTSRNRQLLVVAASREASDYWTAWARASATTVRVCEYQGRSSSNGSLLIARAFQAKGGIRLRGSMQELMPGAVAPLLAHPRVWFDMTSASETQLMALKTHGIQGESCIFESLIRQGWFGGASRLKKGPSILEHRWNRVFPDVMATARTLRSLGVSSAEAMAYFQKGLMHQEPTETMLPSLL